MVDFADAEIMGDFPLKTYCHDGHRCPSSNVKTQDDIFNLGITFYHIMFGSLPYEGDRPSQSEQTKEKYRHSLRKSLACRPILKDLIDGCWEGSKYSCLDEIVLDIKKDHSLSYFSSLTTFTDD